MKEKVNSEIDLVQDSSNNHSNINIDIDHVNKIAAINGINGNEVNEIDSSSDNNNGSVSNEFSHRTINNNVVERTISPYQLKIAGKTYVLYRGENTIGRAISSTIFVDNEFVSRNHATINVDGDKLTITDYSKNGTFVNGCRVFEPTELFINDTISIAKGYKYQLAQVQVESMQSDDMAQDSLVKSDAINDENDEVVDLAKSDKVVENESHKSLNNNELLISGLVAETELVQRLSRFNSLSSRLGSSRIVGNNSNRFGVNAGFSLIELLIVIVIVGIIAAISVPNLLTTKRSANSASAIQTLRLISSSQASYSASIGNGEYATVDDLVREQYIDSGIGAASIPSSSPTQQPKSGYIFVFNRTISNPSSSTLASYEVSARPLFTNGLVASGNKSFFVDSSAVIRVSPSPTPPFADANSQPLN